MEYLLCEQFIVAVSEVFRLSNDLSEKIELTARMGKRILNNHNSTEPPNQIDFVQSFINISFTKKEKDLIEYNARDCNFTCALSKEEKRLKKTLIQKKKRFITKLTEVYELMFPNNNCDQVSDEDDIAQAVTAVDTHLAATVGVLASIISPVAIAAANGDGIAQVITSLMDIHTQGQEQVQEQEQEHVANGAGVINVDDITVASLMDKEVQAHEQGQQQGHLAAAVGDDAEGSSDASDDVDYSDDDDDDASDDDDDDASDDDDDAKKKKAKLKKKRKASANNSSIVLVSSQRSDSNTNKSFTLLPVKYYAQLFDDSEEFFKCGTSQMKNPSIHAQYMRDRLPCKSIIWPLEFLGPGVKQLYDSLLKRTLSPYLYKGTILPNNKQKYTDLVDEVFQRAEDDGGTILNNPDPGLYVKERHELYFKVSLKSFMMNRLFVFFCTNFYF